MKYFLIQAVDPELYIQSCKHSFCSCTTEIQTCVCNTYESYACACKEKGVILDWHPYARCREYPEQDQLNTYNYH